MNRSELIKLLPKNSVGAELGVFLGDFSHELWSTVRPRRLYLVDVWEHIELSYNDKLMRSNKHQLNNYRQVLRKFNRIPEIRIIRERTNIVVDVLEPGELDWVYIDADHSYEGCKADLNNCRDLVKDTGYFLGHDYDATHYPGVIQAVTEFVEENGFILSYVTDEGTCPSYLISKTVEADAKIKGPSTS